MDCTGLVKDTEALRMARFHIKRHAMMKAMGSRYSPTAMLPELTDQECAVLSQEFDAYSYDAIRKAFPKRYGGI